MAGMGSGRAGVFIARLRESLAPPRRLYGFECSPAGHFWTPFASRAMTARNHPESARRSTSALRGVTLAAAMLTSVAKANAQQEMRGPQDAFGQISIGLNTRVGQQFASDWSGSVEGLIGVNRVSRSWYRPTAISGGVTRLFVNGCERQGLGDCIQSSNRIPWISVVTGTTRRTSVGAIRILAGIGAIWAKADLANSASASPVFEARAEYLVFPHERFGAVIFARNLTVTNSRVSLANGIALGVGIAARQPPRY